MYVIDYRHTLVFDENGFNIIRKLLNDERLTPSEESTATLMHQSLIGQPDDSVLGTAEDGPVISIREDQQVLCFGPVEYDIIVRLLEGQTDLYEEENRRADQMNRTLMAMEKARKERRETRNYKRPVRRVERPQIAARR